MSLVDLALPELPALNLEHHPPEVVASDTDRENKQTRKIFAAQAAAIAERQRSIVWQTPSRDEDTAAQVMRKEAPAILVTDGDGAPADGTAPATIQGGRERGLILHKLIEEVLTGETAETLPDLAARAETMIRALGLLVTNDPAQGLAPSELAGCVVRALSLPEVTALRPGLMPEFPLYAATETDTHEEVTVGRGALKSVHDWCKRYRHLPIEAQREHLAKVIRGHCAYYGLTGNGKRLGWFVSGSLTPYRNPG